MAARNFAVRLWPKLAVGDTNLVEDADILMLWSVEDGTFGRVDHSGVHTRQVFDHRVAARLLSDLPNHRVERILRVLDPAARKGPVTLALLRHVTGEQHPPALDAYGVRPKKWLGGRL